MLAGLAVVLALAGLAVAEPGEESPTVRAAAVLPDLRMAGVAPGNLRTVNGGPLGVRFSVSNSGRGSAPRSRVRYLLSRDRRLSRGDVRLRGSSAVGRLRARRRARGATRLTVGPRTRAGRYYLIACADGTRAAREARETNNCGAARKRVLVRTDRSAPRVAISSPASGAALANRTPALAGTAGTALGDSSRVSVRIYPGRAATGQAARTLTARVRRGRWSVTAAPPLAEGAYTARAAQRDGAGHTGRSRAVTVRLDVTAPDVRLDVPAPGARTTDPTPELRGRAGRAEGDAPGVTVNVYASGAAEGTPVFTATATGADWATTASTLPEGGYTARAEQADDAGNVGRSESSFTVAPVNVVAVGDIACRPDHPQFNGGEGTDLGCRQRATSNVALAANPDLALGLGDLQYERGEYANFLASYDPSWGRLKGITRPASGNHEYDDTSCPPGSPACGYFDYFNGPGAQDGPAGPRPKGWYSFDAGAWHVVVLNSECGRFGIECTVGSEQERWLRADLAASTAACTVAVLHKPRFSSATSQGSNVSLAPFWQALYDANADLVLAGHAHDYERFAPQRADGTLDTERGLRQFVVGTGGRNLIQFPTSRIANSEASDDDTYGVLQLTLRSNGYDWNFLRAAGANFTDSGSTACH